MLKEQDTDFTMKNRLCIAYLSSACIPSRTANSIHVIKMCEAFVKAGHAVTLFAPETSEHREAKVDDIFSYYGAARTFRIEYQPWVRVKGRGYWYGWQVARRVKRLGFDQAFGRNLAACYFASLMGVPVIYEVHSPFEDNDRVARHLFNRLIRSRSFKHLVVITDALRRNFENAWPELKGRIVVAPDGADPLEEGAQPIELDGAGERMQVGYTGHLYIGKGVELVIELAQACPEFDFHIVGGADKDLRRWKERNDLPENLRLHGHQPHGQLPGYLLAFDVVLVPNQPEVHAHGGTRDIGRWTSPLKLFEYMAAGRAIVCSDVPVLQEVAEDEVNVLICRHDLIGDWVEALHRLANSPDLRAHLGGTARKQLETLYTWDERTLRVLEPLR